MESVGTRESIKKTLQSQKEAIYGQAEGFAFEPFKGLMAASFTPLSDDSMSVDVSQVDNYAKDLVSQGVTGVFINGTSGQSTSLSVKERKDVLDAWMKTEEVSNGSLKIIVHIGCDSMVDVMELSDHAVTYAQKIQGISVMSPSYFKPSGEIDVSELLVRVAQRSPKVPIYYYHIPFMNGVNVSVAETLKRARKLAPNVVGVKFTSTDLADLQRCARNGFNTLVGADDMLSYALAAGADGAIGITYNFTGKLHSSIIRAFNEKEYQEANEMQKISTELMFQIKNTGNLNGACFYLFEYLRKIPLGASRYPVYKLSDGLKAGLNEYVQQIKSELFP
mmetsp:Transcript_12009/g.15567  ORF Transcript_12009/g.15567 Transcript_12009/m.15567 type:complete len:335 (+) Transcript_12009:92-1096(+)